MKDILKRIGVLLAFIFIANFANAQNDAFVFGRVFDSTGVAAKSVTIAILGTNQGTYSDYNGNFEIAVPSGKIFTLVFSSIGFTTKKVNILLASGERKELKINFAGETRFLPSTEIKEIRNTTFIRIDPKTVDFIPGANNGVEAIIKTMPGVISNNELSSQYSVRGGNYDENLVYVNDIEIYRPFLVRSGQQEGLSFLNSDLVSGISFSAGGFEAKYGDKMSSVLDIQYRKPKEFAGSISASLLGISGHIEGVAKKMPLTFLIGVRQKSNQYLLKSMETKGDYKPSFTDIQGLFTYDFSEKFNISFLGNYARNKYLMVPQTRETDFGTLNQALRLTIYFDGQEVDKFDTYMGAFSANYAPNIKTNLKFIASAFRSLESETYDIQGQYWLDQLENDFGNDQFGQVAFNMGVGTFLNHARNYLDALVYSAEHKGTLSKKKNFISWGAKYQHESISDKMSEWQMIDSAGYTLPYNAEGDLLLQEVVKSKNSLESSRYSGYLQNVWTLDGDSSGFSIRTGIRANYWDVNKQMLISPRATIAYKPNLEKDILFRFSTGYYYQPPFYRELRDFKGNLNLDLKAQETIHFVLGSDWSFKAWGRPFKYIAEVYYKYMDNLVPYEIDNVRIRYYAKNNAKGYAAGIDMKVNGEFVKGIESWASLSVMQTQEDIKNDYYYTYYNKTGEEIIPGYTFDSQATDSIRHEPGYIPRPTDQRVTFSLFFQDYLPKLPSFKMHLNLVYGSGLPFGPSGYERYKDILRIPAYRRVDIGFSYMLKSEAKKLQQSNPFHYLKSVWLSLEVFNLLQTNNTVSYIWIKDVTNRQYAVPNYLTSRQLNLRLITHF